MERHAQPLIVTVTLDAASQQRFDQLRKQYFPPERNVLSAHVTMFHHLPGEHREAIEAQLRTICDATPPCPFTTTKLRFLGYGSAYDLQMPGMATLRAGLVALWSPWLTAQDRQPWRPHVTVQNKVAAAVARQTYSRLQSGFTPSSGQALGLGLWAYLGGPWQLLRHTPFCSSVLEP